jgi:hypothetical protein
MRRGRRRRRCRLCDEHWRRDASSAIADGGLVTDGAVWDGKRLADSHNGYARRFEHAHGDRQFRHGNANRDAYRAGIRNSDADPGN